MGLMVLSTLRAIRENQSLRDLRGLELLQVGGRLKLKTIVVS